MSAGLTNCTCERRDGWAPCPFCQSLIEDARMMKEAKRQKKRKKHEEQE